jgi:alcohol dehydrogenase
MDAIAHAVETAASTRRNEASREFSMQAWRLLEPVYERAVRDRNNDSARAQMLLGAHVAGIAIEQAMLGAAHACANPLTARHNLSHGVAVGVMLPHVIRFNALRVADAYADLCSSGDALAARIEVWMDAVGIPRRLREHGVGRESLPLLSEAAAKQWTARFNPRPVTASDLLSIYQSAYD